VKLQTIAEQDVRGEARLDLTTQGLIHFSGAMRIWSAEQVVRKSAMVTRKSPLPTSLRLAGEVANASLRRRSAQRKGISRAWRTDGSDGV
jgi:hypothetical protein